MCLPDDGSVVGRKLSRLCASSVDWDRHRLNIPAVIRSEHKYKGCDVMQFPQKTTLFRVFDHGRRLVHRAEKPNSKCTPPGYSPSNCRKLYCEVEWCDQNEPYSVVSYDLLMRQYHIARGYEVYCQEPHMYSLRATNSLHYGTRPGGCR